MPIANYIYYTLKAALTRTTNTVDREIFVVNFFSAVPNDAEAMKIKQCENLSFTSENFPIYSSLHYSAILITATGHTSHHIYKQTNPTTTSTLLSTPFNMHPKPVIPILYTYIHHKPILLFTTHTTIFRNISKRTHQH